MKRSPVKRKSRSPVKRKSQNNDILFGGVYKKTRGLKRKINMKVPSDIDSENIMSTFKMTEDKLTEFRRIASRSNDCVINAMQLIGSITEKEAALLRIVRGEEGLSPLMITRIFTSLLPHKFSFNEVSSYSKFEKMVKTLKNGHALFAGYSQVTQGKTFNHVFLIARNLIGNIVLIDPQLPERYRFCDLSEAECENIIKGKNSYFLLYNSKRVISLEERVKLVGREVTDDRSFRITTPMDTSEPMVFD